MCYINPKVDFAFKKLFGSEENKDLLISLINSIVSEKDQVIDITLKNPYNLVDYLNGKMSILDIKAVGHNDHWYNIEMQVNSDAAFDKRAIYYWAKMVTEQLGNGRVFGILNKTVSINILAFNYLPGSDAYHNLYKITNTTTGIQDDLHDIFELHYVELKKFHKEIPDVVNALDRWAIFLTRAYELKKGKIPEALALDKAIVKAIAEVDRMFNEEERILYETRMQVLADVESKIASAGEAGEKRGEKRGGKKERYAIALNLLDILDDETISLKTGLSRQDVAEIRKQTDG